MLRSAKTEQKATLEPEMLFIERYDRMLGWSLQLTGRDRDLAEDLLHDLFVQFVLNGPDVSQIENLDGYLYISLRNLNIAQQRRANRNRLVQLSLVDYDSAEIGLSTVDFRDQLAAQEELRIICRYACARKENAKIASVLILRFFHGYYPDEITQVSGSPRAAVDKWISLARGEAKASLEKDGKLAFLAKTELPEVQISDLVHKPADLLAEMKSTIFRSRQGECLDQTSLASIYDPRELKPVECLHLAHIVSCQVCLDGVNEVLGLDLLATRNATDTLTRDSRKRDDDDKGGSGGGGADGGGMTDPMLGMLRRKVKDTFSHRPQELCVAVNGYALGSHRVSAERSELNLVVERNEPIDFVEVYTDQKIRLLLHNIEEQPPAGPGERGCVVRLSDDRLLELNLRFTSPSPTIQITYLDPMFNLVDGLAVQSDGEIQIAANNGEAKAADALPPFEELPEPGRFSQFLKDISTLGFWLRPGAITAVISGVLIVSLALLLLRPPSVTITSAPALLQKVAETETALATRADLVIHRTVGFEARSLATGEVKTTQTIDIWYGGASGRSARRLFDQNGRLIAGEFKADGTGTTYTRRIEGAKKPADAGKQTVAVRAPQQMIQNPDAVWQLTLSAKDFTELVGKIDDAALTDTADRYLVNYQSPNQANIGLIRANLVVAKADYRPIEQTFVVRSGPNAGTDDLVEYHFVEKTFEQRSPNTVAPSVFEPDAELLVPEATVVTKTEDTHGPDADTAANSNTNVTAPPTAIATADLEVEVLRLLNQAGADIDDQTDVSRTSDGRLLVTGLVDSRERKAEIVRALASVAGNPALVIRVETYEEVAARQKPAGTPTSVERIEITKGRIAVYEDVARHLGKSGDADADAAVQRFSASVLNRSRLVMSQAGTLKKLSGRFSRDDLKNMTPEARSKWLAVVRSHASNCEVENRKLRQDLSALFGISSGASGEPGAAIDTDAELQAAAARLFAEAAANDRVIRSAFTISGDGAAVSPIKNQAFLRAMSGVERLAASLQRAK